jgi:general secretion pathway protein G
MPVDPPKPDNRDIAKKQIKDLDAALKTFQADTGYLPHSVNSGMVVALSSGRRAVYYRFNRDELNARNEAVDVWGNPLIYHSPGRKGAAFDLFSCGPNGKDECGAGDDIGNW